MKRCTACNHVFADQFLYCPSDAFPLLQLPAFPKELHLTFIDNSSLLDRLAQESRFCIAELRRSWPDMKRDPIATLTSVFRMFAIRHLQPALAPNSIAAITTALVVLFSAFLLLVLLDRRSHPLPILQTEIAKVQILNFPTPQISSPPDRGVGAGSEGRVGLRHGRGEGSGPKPKASTGGGGGGDGDKNPAQTGAVPPPSVIPASIPKFPPTQKTALPAAGVDIDPALWKALPIAHYGDPRSASVPASNGPGEDGGMGTGKGTGVGEGLRNGFGPGKDGNIGGGANALGCCGEGGGVGRNPNPDDADRVYPQGQVNERAQVLSKPEPQYTEEARKGGITGSVVLRVVFSRTGEVTNIRALQTLPFGLTERAIAAARQIRFRPAMRGGRAVNVSMQLEYNFNLY
jgi:TonB family protein